ncbi:hypothetical protein BD311DRAFT_755541 [Dichomitus squalens]|uniref:Uncharacterized protein n=1 Tax=Dichomitus squalens TaxID=114155 RepID=A0A4Q9MQA9_9APHY|nr:hypothetical protein BD311DRAFT_755541 [Dichomitus squalens]
MLPLLPFGASITQRSRSASSAGFLFGHGGSEGVPSCTSSSRTWYWMEAPFGTPVRPFHDDEKHLARPSIPLAAEQACRRSRGVYAAHPEATSSRPVS